MNGFFTESINWSPKEELINTFDRETNVEFSKGSSIKGRTVCLLRVPCHVFGIAAKPTVYAGLFAGCMIASSFFTITLLFDKIRNKSPFCPGEGIKEILTIGINCYVNIIVSPIGQIAQVAKAAAGVLHPGAYFTKAEKQVNELPAIAPRKTYRPVPSLDAAIATCDAIRNLYEQANSTPGFNGNNSVWTVDFFDPASRDLGGSTAFCSPSRRKISIRSDLSNADKLSAFVFELTNAISSGRFHAIEIRARSGLLDRENFTKEIERVEHEGALVHHRIITEAIREMQWPKSLDCYKHLPQDFETHWNQIKFTPHANHYRECWDQIQGYVYA